MNKETHTPKILFTDMDGTLLLSDSTVSPVMKETLNRLTEAGHKLVLTSGRPLDSILEVMEAAGLFYPGTLIISNNGSLIYDCSARTPLMEKTVSFPIVADIMPWPMKWRSTPRPIRIMKSYAGGKIKKLSITGNESICPLSRLPTSFLYCPVRRIRSIASTSPIKTGWRP